MEHSGSEFQVEIVAQQITAIAATGVRETVRNDRAVGLWLLIIAGLIGLMVVIGGLTRLTGSGLSITEWHPVTGALPPLSDRDWLAEFAKYRGTSQYELINKGMGLAGFKAIYWWEWSHRFLGRLLGVVFLFPFVYFALKRRIDRPLVIRLGVIFLLGAAQGVLGWWMVQSGLEPARVVVSQYRLAAHLGLAVILFGYVFWAALEVLSPPRSTHARSAGYLRPWAIVLVGLIFVQILLGALMAGLDAGLAFSTWPTYGGAWFPPGLYDLSPWWINHFENHAMVHFQHRTVGYETATYAVWFYLAILWLRADQSARLTGLWLVLITLVQVTLGVLTVVSKVALPFAALHQICALALFGVSLWLVYTFTLDRQHLQPDIA